jgi:hypothetical protein
MAFLEGMIGTAVGLGIVLVLLRYSGHGDAIRKATGFIAAGILFYVVDVAWSTGTFATMISSAAVGWLTFVWELIAFILIVIGALWGAANLITKPK